MKKGLYILFTIGFLLNCAETFANQTIITAKMDSATLLMGKKTTIHLEIVQDKGAIGILQGENATPDTLNTYVEVSKRLVADTVDLGNNRIQINKEIIIQSFDSGMYAIPPFKFIVDNDTFKSDMLSLKVIPVKVDSLQTIHDFKPVETPEFYFSDLLPEFLLKYWWVILLIQLLLIGGLYAYFKWFRKGVIPFVTKPIVIIPPYDEAIMKLTQLKSEKLWEAGQDKEYFTRLTDILRNYLDRRFNINAMEMTTSQIMSTLRKNEETMPVNDQLNKILDMADFVKFAKMRPLPEDNEVAYQRAVNFVNETKPLELPAEENNEQSNNNEREEVKKK